MVREQGIGGANEIVRGAVTALFANVSITYDVTISYCGDCHGRPVQCNQVHSCRLLQIHTSAVPYIMYHTNATVA